MRGHSKKEKKRGRDSFKIKGIRLKEKQTKREKRERWRERKGLERHPSIMTDYCNSGCQEHRPVRLTPINSSVHYRALRRHTDGRDCCERKTQAEPNNLSGLVDMADENRFPPLFSLSFLPSSQTSLCFLEVASLWEENSALKERLKVFGANETREAGFGLGKVRILNIIFSSIQWL